MLLVLEGIAGAGKSTVRDRLLETNRDLDDPIGHVGQFSWLSLDATRILIKLRAGHPAPSIEDAERAAIRDLELHARHNLAPALHVGPVIADRLTLSTACLLALLHGRPVTDHVGRLAEVTEARADLTILLTTPPELCQTRVSERTAGRRFSDDATTAARLSDLYAEAASAWTDATGLPVLRHTCASKSDLDLVVAACLDRLRPATPMAPRI